MSRGAVLFSLEEDFLMLSPAPATVRSHGAQGGAGWGPGVFKREHPAAGQLGSFSGLDACFYKNNREPERGWGAIK